MRLILKLLMGIMLAQSSHAAIILTTDFNNTTESGPTLQGVTFTTSGVSVPANPANITINNTIQNTGNGDLFTTAAADGVLAVANNTGNGGEFNFGIAFTTGASSIQLTDFTFDFLNFNGEGDIQNGTRNTEITFDILDAAGVSVLSVNPLVQNTATVSSATVGVQTELFNLTGNALAANTTFTLFIQAGDATTVGNNFGFDAITLNGNIIPEPSSIILCFSAVGLLFFSRGRRRA